MTKDEAKNLAGYIACRKNRITGDLLVLYRAAHQGIDDDGGKAPYATVCEAHKTIATHATRALALSHLPTADWCEACQDIKEQQEPRPLIRLPESDYRDPNGGQGRYYPCVICNRDVKHPRYTLHVVDAGFHAVHPDDEPYDDGGSDLGYLPIGTECLRRFPQLKPYVHREESDKSAGGLINMNDPEEIKRFFRAGQTIVTGFAHEVLSHDHVFRRGQTNLYRTTAADDRIWTLAFESHVRSNRSTRVRIGNRTRRWVEVVLRISAEGQRAEEIVLYSRTITGEGVEVMHKHEKAQARVRELARKCFGIAPVYFN